MKAADLDILLQEGEGVMLENKEGLSGSLARELVAFANTAGGRILLGVRDDGTLRGIADTNELRARIQDLARNCDPPVKILVQRIGQVTVVTVRESDAKPVQCRKSFPVGKSEISSSGPGPSASICPSVRASAIHMILTPINSATGCGRVRSHGVARWRIF
jgi:predicted HTH transcriptional regulator